MHFYQLDLLTLQSAETFIVPLIMGTFSIRRVRHPHMFSLLQINPFLVGYCTCSNTKQKQFPTRENGEYMQKSILKSNVPLLFMFLGLMLIFSINAKAQSDADNTTSSTFPAVQPAAENSMKPHIGLQVGYADSGNTYDGATNYGLEVGYQPYIPLGAAIEVTNFTNDGDDGTDLERTTAMAKGTYNFGGVIPVIRNSFAGIGLGAVIDSAGANETNFGAKALVGADFPLTGNGLTRAKSFSLGAVASYLSVVDAEDTLAINGQLKYWF